jgi:hypothetical protein
VLGCFIYVPRVVLHDTTIVLPAVDKIEVVHGDKKETRKPNNKTGILPRCFDHFYFRTYGKRRNEILNISEATAP